jgi:hypothetical protein
MAIVMAGCSVTLGAPASARDAIPHAANQGRLTIGLHVPWAVGGPRIERTGRLNDFPGEWPDIPFASVRLWDTRTAWLNVEPAQDQWDFEMLDANVGNRNTDQQSPSCSFLIFALETALIPANKMEPALINSGSQYLSIV